MNTHQRKISVIGLGYVGLPVAVAFAKHGTVIAYDIETQRVAELKQGYDCNQEVETNDINNPNIQFTSNPTDLQNANFHIIAVPTPVDEQKQPNLLPVLKASKIVGQQLKAGDIVVYESTVYPGATEEMCIPVLERESGLQCSNQKNDFSVGYSPERINPGDKTHHFTNIIKIVSGFDESTLEIIAQVYESVVIPGIHRAPSIKVAEAAKVIENVQRDINIAFMNELALIFKRMGIDTHDVLAACGTKWNFLPFTPGLVGGHCIGVDPYYLTHKAKQLGYNPQIIPAARQINDKMGQYIAQHVLDSLKKDGYLVEESTITILGFSFKENVSDLRNTRVIDIVTELTQHSTKVQIHDPHVDPQKAYHEYGVTLRAEKSLQKAQCLILAVPHQIFIQSGWSWFISLLENKQGSICDVKGALPRENVPASIKVWRL
jgi:UDP-N-acetyl-D-galactosamine dehydrogenase